MIKCPKCGKKLSNDTKFCDGCGASIPEAPAGKKALPKKAIMFGAIGAAAVVVLIVVISLFSGGGGNGDANYAIYLKESEIFLSDLKKDSEAWQLTSRLVDADEIEDARLAGASDQLGTYTYVSEDGKYIFFPDKIGDEEGGFSLYCKDLTDPEAEAVKVDSEIQRYTVNTSATLVTYTKGDEKSLYQYKVGEDSKDKIASEVVRFEVSDDGKDICYINSENGIYVKHGDADKEKIASDVSSFNHVTKDFKTVYYVKEGSLYKQTEGADKVKIANDVYSVGKIYDSGEVYYFIDKTADEDGYSELSVMDFIDDDMKEADDAMTYPDYPEYPDYPDYPDFWYYDDYEAYEAAWNAYEAAYEAAEAEWDRLYAEYEAARDAWYEKETRDDLRYDFEYEYINAPKSYTLCFYNGTEEVVITDSYVGNSATYASDAPVMTYEEYSGTAKMKFSELYSDYTKGHLYTYEVREKVEENLASSAERYIAVKGAATVVEQEKKASAFRIDPAGTVVYYMDDVADEKVHGGLYRVSLSNGAVGKAELYDSDVYIGGCYFTSDTDIKYFKEYKNGKGELYINKNRVDYDVWSNVVQGHAELGKVLYYTDWNEDKQYGTLKVYDGKESVKIADDVHDFSVIPDGRVLYLYDYSLNYYKGELQEWSNGETRKIDDDVVCLIPTSESKYRSYGYVW